MKKEIVAILLFAFLLRGIVAYADNLKGWDESIYASLGWQIKEGHNYAFEKFDDRNFDFGNSAGFRAPLLPNIIALVYWILGDGIIAVSLIMPIFGTLGVYAAYLLGKELFDEKVGLYSALFLTILPIHVINSGLILTDVLVTTMLTFSVLFFQKGFIKNQKYCKELCGFTTALAVLARYTALFVLPVYLIIWLWKGKPKLKLELISTIIIVLITLSPWLAYSYEEYGTPLGALIHSEKAPGYCCGEQLWYYFFLASPIMFGFFSLAFAYVLIRFDKRDLLLWLWIIVIFFFINSIPHKEMRYVLPFIPALVILTAKELKENKKMVVFLVATSLILLFAQVKFLWKDHPCFFKSVEFLKQTEENAVLITWPSPRYYFYTHREAHFPETNLIDQIKNYEKGYIVWLWDDEFYDDERPELNKLEKVFSCVENDKRIEIFN